MEIRSAARSTSSQVSRKNEAWWNRPFSVCWMKATSWALVDRLRNCAHALEVARPGFRIDLLQPPFAGVLLVGVELEKVSGRCLEAHPPTATLEFAGGDGFDQAAIIEQILGQAVQASLIEHLEAHEIHARLIGLAQHHGEFVDLGPGLQVDAPLLVAVHFDQTEQVAVMGQGTLQIEYAQLDVTGAHYAFFHDDTSCWFLLLWSPGPWRRRHSMLRSVWGNSWQARARPCLAASGGTWLQLILWHW